MSSRRVPRRISTLFRKLEEEIGLLSEHTQKAFRDRDHRYLGEVAGKLRLLVVEMPRNRNHRPLLLALMDELKVDPAITFGGPPVEPMPGQPDPRLPMRLREYFGYVGPGTQLSSGEFKSTQVRDVIRQWAEQSGSAHQDWAHSEEFAQAREDPVYIVGEQASVHLLSQITSVVLEYGFRFIASVTPEMLRAADASKGKRLAGKT